MCCCSTAIPSRRRARSSGWCASPTPTHAPKSSARSCATPTGRFRARAPARQVYGARPSASPGSASRFTATGFPTTARGTAVARAWPATSRAPVCWRAAKRYTWSACWTKATLCTVRKPTGACGCSGLAGRYGLRPTPQSSITAGKAHAQVRHAMVTALLRSKVRFFHKHKGPLQAALLRAMFVGARGTRRLAQVMRRLVIPSTAVDPPIRWRDLGPAAPRSTGSPVRSVPPVRGFPGSPGSPG